MTESVATTQNRQDLNGRQRLIYNRASPIAMEFRRAYFESNSSTPNEGGHGKEGGILNGVGPFATDILLLLIYILFIQFLVRLLVIPMKWIKQPQVIAEILAGILLGPTAFGKIPGFTDTLFPVIDLRILHLFSNFGLFSFVFRLFV